MSTCSDNMMTNNHESGFFAQLSETLHVWSERRRQRFEHVEQVASDRHFAHRVGKLAILDPETGRAAAIVAGDQIDARADQVGDVEAIGNVGDEFLRARRRRLHQQALGTATRESPRTKGLQEARQRARGARILSPSMSKANKDP